MENIKMSIKQYILDKWRAFTAYIQGREFRSNVLFILFLILIRAMVLGNYSVPTGSMNPTILEGDKFFSNKLAYSIKIPFTKIHPIRWGIPERGDVIAFIFPHNEKIDYTKRVIGIPGDTVTVDGHDLYINGSIIEKEKIREDEEFIYYEEHLFGVDHVIKHSKYNDFPRKEYFVPENELFVMGDNRDNSADSRYWGTLPVEYVTGKLFFRWMSNVPGRPWELRLGRIGPFN